MKKRILFKKQIHFLNKLTRENLTYLDSFSLLLVLEEDVHEHDIAC